MITAESISIRRVLGEVGPSAAVMLLYDICVAVGYVKFGWDWLCIPHIPLSIFGGVIGAIVGFRNNSSYARWWEARTLWGQIVNNSRSLARQVLSMIEQPEADNGLASEAERAQRKIVILQTAYVYTLRSQLRGLSPWSDLENLLGVENVSSFRKCRNVALCIQKQIASLIAKCFENGFIDNLRWSAIDRTLSDLLNAQGGLERIKNTPMPKQYDVFPRICVAGYCLLLPLGMVANLRLFTPLGSTLVGLIFLALDQIGRDLENPFENRVHDIPMTAMSRVIDIDLRQLLGDSDVPEPEKPVDGVLW